MTTKTNKETVEVNADEIKLLQERLGTLTNLFERFVRVEERLQQGNESFIRLRAEIEQMEQRYEQLRVMVAEISVKQSDDRSILTRVINILSKLGWVAVLGYIGITHKD